MREVTAKVRQVTRHLNFLWEAAGILATACPEQARYLRCLYRERAVQAAKVTNDRRRNLPGFCTLCGTELRAGSCRVRVHRRAGAGASQRVAALLRDAAARDERGERLEPGIARRLRRHRGAAGTIVVTCFTCKRTQRIRGGTRAEIAATASHRRRAGTTEGGTEGWTSRRRRKAAAEAEEASGSPAAQRTPVSGKATTPSPRTPGGFTPTTVTPRGRATLRASPAAATSRSTKQSPASSTPSSAKRKPFAQLKQLLQMEQQRQQQKGSLKDFLSSI